MKALLRNISGLLLTAITVHVGALEAYPQQIKYPDRWLQRISDVPPLFSNDTLTICVAGDIMMHSMQIEDALQPDSTYRFHCFDLIKDKISGADLAIANMEFTLAGKPYSGYPRFSAPDSFALYIAECGFDIFLTANNHILDMGSKGAARTLEIYRELEQEHSIRYTGCSYDHNDSGTRNPLIVQKEGFRLALMNMTYGTNLGRTEEWPDINYIGETGKLELMAATAEQKGADLLMAFPHWGTEYQLRHSASQEKTAMQLIDHGADLIIGTHPHVVQDFQVTGHEKIPVAYSLGNAVSNMSAQDTQIELLATVRITRDSYGHPKILPMDFTYLWCSRPGGYTDTYMVLPVKDFIGTREIWDGKWEYDKMIESYHRVMIETGITE